MVSFCRLCATCHDPAAKFMRMMARGGATYLVSDDFVPLIQVNSWVQSNAIIMRFSLWQYYIQLVMSTAEHKSDFWRSKDTPYFALMGELWGAICDSFGGNWPHYNGITQYIEQFYNAGCQLLLNLYYKRHQIPKLYCFSSRHAVVFT